MILLLGSGGREHALGWKLAQSPTVRQVMSAPGNPGLASIGPTFPELDILDPVAVADTAESNHIDLVVIGPEAPLAAGVADELTKRGILVFGPTQEGARLEDYVKSFSVSERQSGALFAIEGRLVGLELFDSSETLKKLFAKLIRSYGLDALDRAASKPSGEESRCTR